MQQLVISPENGRQYEPASGEKESLEITGDMLPVQSVSAADLFFTWIRLRVRILWLAWKAYRSPVKMLRAIRSLYDMRSQIFGRRGARKVLKREGHYFFALYVPPFPSRAFDHYILHSLNRFIPALIPHQMYSHLQVAITSKCPMSCAHCLEWNNLHRSETFSLAEWERILYYYVQKGFCSIHFSGGEPMVRIRDLPSMIRAVGKGHDSWVLSSGFNVTKENAALLKNAGARGMIISLDDTEPSRHDRFRGYDGAFEGAVSALRNAREAGLVTAMSVCVTREFLERAGSLMDYAELAKSLGATFIQLLEPKVVGRFEGKDVLLSDEQCKQLETFMFKLNYERAYKDYPIVIYHGHYQRKSGCAQGGNRNMYIDAAGNANACPFCRTADFNVREILQGQKEVPDSVAACPAFTTLA
jgi:MoaA/NifB/PqqE/SkfB family radical SAM enzyme